MKKILAFTVVLALLFCVGIAIAEEVKEEASLADDILKVLKLEDSVQGIGYSAVTGKVNYMFTKPIYKKDKGFWHYVNAGIGYNSEDKIVGSLFLHVLSLKDLGVTTPILDLVDVWAGGYAGWGRVQLGGGMAGNNEWDYGATVTLIRLKK